MASIQTVKIEHHPKKKRGLTSSPLSPIKRAKDLRVAWQTDSESAKAGSAKYAMGDTLGTAGPGPQVVKAVTRDGEEVLEHDFVQVCSKVVQKVQEAGPCEEVAVNLADVWLSGLQMAVAYWHQSKTKSFDSAQFLRSLTGEKDRDFFRLVTAAMRLGYDDLFQQWDREFSRRTYILSMSPKILAIRKAHGDVIVREPEWEEWTQ